MNATSRDRVLAGGKKEVHAMNITETNITKTKITICTDKGRIEVPAFPTESPELFVTSDPRIHRLTDEFGSASKHRFAVIHPRTGKYVNLPSMNLPTALDAASLLGGSGIPWEKLGIADTPNYENPLCWTWDGRWTLGLRQSPPEECPNCHVTGALWAASEGVPSLKNRLFMESLG
jgi:hypothetical protein